MRNRTARTEFSSAEVGRDMLGDGGEGAVVGLPPLASGDDEEAMRGTVPEISRSKLAHMTPRN